MVNESDIELVRIFQNEEDLDALAILFGRYRSLIYGVCLKYFKDQERAKDATMDLFEILKRRLVGKDIENFKAWLYVLVKNHCFEKLRKSSKDLTKDYNAAIVYSEQVFHPDSIDKEMELNKMHECLEKLKVNQKECVRLFYLESKNYEEIAKQLKIEWNKVRSFIQNGRRNLKICMEKK